MLLNFDMYLLVYSKISETIFIEASIIIGCPEDVDGDGAPEGEEICPMCLNGDGKGIGIHDGVSSSMSAFTAEWAITGGFTTQLWTSPASSRTN
jgi:hypothetical protein